jgi:hypothetical protein
MPPRQYLRENEAPYSQVLSALRKNDLMRLCVEFGLPVDGPVVTLRHRLKDYLNLHRNTLYRNPRFTGLFPKHRKGKHDPRPKLKVRPRSPSTSSSRSSHTHTDSDHSWHGIDYSAINQPDPRHVQHSHSPRERSPSDRPLPSRSPTFSFRAASPPAIQPVVNRK